MATLARSGRISEADVRAEAERSQTTWDPRKSGDSEVLATVLSHEKIAELDLFDQLQLTAVISICRECRTLSEAGRRLFSISRLSKNSSNDADRLRKYLTRFGLSWANLAMSQDP
jgi:transcriptional regulatory protein RtcR